MRNALLIFTLLILAACGGASEDSDDGPSGTVAPAATGLTEQQLENGIGPIQSVSLDDIDEELAPQGAEIFKTKCSACHKMDERYVGPALEDVLERRTVTFVMNMMLNPEEMVQKHPEVRAMLAEYMTPMPNQQLTEQDARAVVAYLREESDE